MRDGPVLHVFLWDKKFVAPFIAFVRENFRERDHEFLIYGEISPAELEALGKVVYCRNPFKSITLLSRHLRKSRKVILHGLFSIHLYYVLVLHAWLLRKCYWIIWGGDLYVHINHWESGWRRVKNECVRRFVISRIGNLVTCIKGDAELAGKWYGAKGEICECFSYTSNIYRDSLAHLGKVDGVVNILIGNSADPSNNQHGIIDKLFPYRDRNIVVYAALSYGNPVHAELVCKYGKEKLGNKFKPLNSFMPLNEYLAFLSKIDVAIFNHNRQQAMGNTITLLGQGKKVFVRSDTTQWPFLIGMGLTLFDSKTLDLDSALSTDTTKNTKIIAKYFNVQKLRKQYEVIFS